MRVALIVGIDYYKHGKPLFGCVSDARSVRDVLERHEDKTKNFDCILLTATEENDSINKNKLKDSIDQLFKKDANIALFYFAGHGHIEPSGGYILASDAKRGDEGVCLSDVLTYANSSPAKNKLIILDSCHSGIAGDSVDRATSNLSEGLTILTASTKDQYASEINGRGVFTSLLVDALNGSAANLIGDVTPGSIYAHIDQSLGAWEQRPVFKTNIKQFASIRQVLPAISLEELRRITEFFPNEGYEYQLNPTYEPEMRGREADMPAPEEKNTKIFSILQKYNRLNLLIPVDTTHMWNAAMESRACKLTQLGEHYRRLVFNNRI